MIVIVFGLPLALAAQLADVAGVGAGEPGGLQGQVRIFLKSRDRDDDFDT